MWLFKRKGNLVLFSLTVENSSYRRKQYRGEMETDRHHSKENSALMPTRYY